MSTQIKFVPNGGVLYTKPRISFVVKPIYEIHQTDGYLKVDVNDVSRFAKTRGYRLFISDLTSPEGFLIDTLADGGTLSNIHSSRLYECQDNTIADYYVQEGTFLYKSIRENLELYELLVQGIYYQDADIEDRLKLYISQGFDIETKGFENETLLHYAADLGCIGIIMILLDNGACQHVIDGFDEKPIHKALHNEQISCVKLFLNSSHYDDDLLCYAVNRESYEVTEMLLKRGVSANVKDKVGGLPLYYAIKQGYIEIIQLLFQYGATLIDEPIEHQYFGKTTLLELAAEKDDVVYEMLASFKENKKLDLHIDTMDSFASLAF